MITWHQPVVRGQMSFTGQQTTVVDGFTAGGSTTINVTGTTVSASTSASGTQATGSGTNTGVIATNSSFSSSSSSVTTLEAYTTTTNTFPIPLYTTQQTTETVTKYTTSATSDTFVFTTTTATQTAQAELFETTSTSITVTTQSGSATANTYDTVILCDHSELAMVLTSVVYLDEWNGQGSVAQGTITGTRLTVSADIKTSEVFAVPYPYSSQGSVGAVTESYSFTFSNTSTTTTFSSTVYDFERLPNRTYTVERQSGVFVQSQTTISESWWPAFVHSGNTKTAAISSYRFGPVFGIKDNGETFLSAAYATNTTAKTITITSPYVFAPSNGSAGGNSTYAETREYVGLQRIGETDFNLGGGYESKSPAICYIVKPYGVIHQGQSGAYVTISNTTFQSAYPLACVSRQVPFLNFDNARAIRKLSSTSNESVTISGNNVTYTVTDGQTVSQEISLSGAFTSGLVATKSVLGGEPEQSATFYEVCPRGLFINQSGGTTTMNGSYTSFASGDSRPTSVLINVPYLSVAENSLPAGIGGGQSSRKVIIFNNQELPTFASYVYESR